MSELIVAKVLKDGYREKTKLATKLPSWLVKSRGDKGLGFITEYIKKISPT
jgi:predicted aldo/keto reductase-like oxidoreductase